MKASNDTAGLSLTITSSEPDELSAIEQSMRLRLESTQDPFHTLGMNTELPPGINDSYETIQDQQSEWTMAGTGINPSVLAYPEGYDVHCNGGESRAIEPALRLPPVEIRKGDTTELVYRMDTAPQHGQVQKKLTAAKKKFDEVSETALCKACGDNPLLQLTVLEAAEYVIETKMNAPGVNIQAKISEDYPLFVLKCQMSEPSPCGKLMLRARIKNPKGKAKCSRKLHKNSSKAGRTCPNVAQPEK